MDSQGQVLSPLPPYVPFGDPFKRLFGPCRSTQAQLIQKREIRSVLVGETRGRRMIDTASYLEYLERQRQREAAGEIPEPSRTKAPARSSTRTGAHHPNSTTAATVSE